MAENNSEFPTIIGSDARFKGELKFEKGVRLLGTFEGTIDTKGQLHVANGANLKADVNAGEIQVEGNVKGNLNATGKVLLKASAKLEGDLRTSKLEVAEGAVFVGNCVVGPQNGTPAQSPASAAGPPVGSSAPAPKKIPVGK